VTPPPSCTGSAPAGDPVDGVCVDIPEPYCEDPVPGITQTAVDFHNWSCVMTPCAGMPNYGYCEWQKGSVSVKDVMRDDCNGSTCP